MCPALCDPMDLHVTYQAPLSMGFSSQEYWKYILEYWLPFPSPRQKK